MANLKQIVDGFVMAIPYMDYDIVDRIIKALENEKRIRNARQAFVESVQNSGRQMTADELMQGILEFQRLVESANVISESITGKRLPERKLDAAPKVKAVAEDDGAKPVIGNPPTAEKKYIDDFDKMVDDCYPEE